MSMILLALALAAPLTGAAREGDEDRGRARVTCAVEAHTLDARGRERSARQVSAATSSVVVFRGQVSERDRDGQSPLVFDVFNPRGQRYQVLLAESRARRSDRHRVERVSRVREAALAVAGSSIALTSMYGRWRVEPRIEGQSQPCGRPEYFTIRP